MAVDCADFIVFAERLANGDQEIEWRNAGSRAYYASWHATSDLDRALSRHAEVPRKGGTQEKRIKKFSYYPLEDNPDQINKETAGTIRAIGRMLNILKMNRVRADYRVNDSYSQADAQANIEGAKRLIEEVMALTGQLDRASQRPAHEAVRPKPVT